MDYFDAATATCTDLADDTTGEVTRAALHLALLPWTASTEVGRWERVALDLLDADDLLSSLPSSMVICEPPHPDDPRLPVAVGWLTRTLATHLDALASDEARDLALRLACDAAAAQVRRAAARLP